MLSRFINSLAGNLKAAESGRTRLKLSVSGYEAVYAIGDIHGRHDLLRTAERRICKAIGEGERSLVVYLGDYVDRGPDSKAVLEHLSSKPDGNIDRVCLCGNHDDAMLQFIRSPLEHMQWLDFGGRETLRSYGIDISQYRITRKNELEFKELLRSTIPEKHIDFLAEAPVMLEIGKVLFVHAGIEPGMPLEEQDDADLMWIREPFLSEGPRLDIKVVHGHTPSETVSVGPNRIGIDTAAYVTGNLTVVQLKDGKLREF